MSPPLPPSARLAYRRLGPSDLPFLIDLLNSPGWLANIGDRNVRTDTEALAYLETRLMPACTEPQFGPWAMYRQAGDGALMGTVGIHQRAGLDSPDLGYALLPAHEGQGFASEAATHLLAFAEARGFRHVSAITLPQNLRSAAILRRSGFQHLGTVRLPGEDVDLDHWQWAAPGAPPENSSRTA